MITVIFTAAAVVIVAGLYLRWACRPLGIAYWAGKNVARANRSEGER